MQRGEDPEEMVLKALLEEREARKMRFWDSSAIIPLCLKEAALKAGFTMLPDN